MDLSEVVASRLRECFEAGDCPPVRPATYRFGGRWHCPADGTVMAEADGLMQCQTCGRSLNSFMYQLIERHVHP